MSKHVLIIGGGVIGLSTAWYCLRRGHRVTVLDRNRATRDGCSFGNAGMIVPSHFVPLAAPGMIGMGLRWMANPESPFYIRPRLSGDLVKWLWQFQRACSDRRVRDAAPLLRDLHMASRQRYEELTSELGDFGLVKRGLLMLCKTEAALQHEAETAKMADRLGIPNQVLNPRETSELDPGIEMDVCGSVYFPKDCHLSPNRLMSALEERLAEDGCDFKWETDCQGFARNEGMLAAAKTSRGDIEADEFVLCGGIWSTEVGRDLQLSLPMQAGKGYSVTVPDPVQLPEICSILTEARVAVTPIGSSLRLGGTMEIVGIDESISASRVRGIVQSVPKYFPKFSVGDLEGLEPWVGLRPCSPDGLPYLGRTSRWKNLVVSTGHAMMGISLALVSGSVASELIDGVEPQMNRRELLSPDRYA